MKKFITFIIILFLMINKVYALSICTASDEYLEYSKLSDEEKKYFIEPIYCKEIIGSNIKKNTRKSYNNLRNGLPSSYNAYNEGLVTSVKNQGVLGSCWAFSSVSAVESNALKNGLQEYNFSEQHVIDSVISAAYSDAEGQKGKYVVPDLIVGGKTTYVASYYYNDYGQLLESELPYRNSTAKITKNDYVNGRKIISLENFEIANINDFSSCTNEEIDSIKSKILEFGSVQGSMYMKENLFKDSNKNYYIATTSNYDIPNHGISIVGWDDNISGSNFNVDRQGAFIIKNSYGENYSEDGFFYVSYDDNFICKNTVTFTGVSNQTFDYSYASSDLVGIPTFTYSDDLYLSSRFTKKSNGPEEINRISFAVGADTSYNVYLSKDNNINDSNSWRLLASGTSQEYGIKSVNLTDEIIYDDFTIIIKYTSSFSSLFTMCNNSDDTYNMDYSSNTNYYSIDSVIWDDMVSMNISSQVMSCEPNIYVYTNDFEVVGDEDIRIDSVSTNDTETIINIVNLGIDTNTINYSILLNDNDVTSHFTITPNYETNRITVTSDGTISGNFTFNIIYDNTTVNTHFKLIETIVSKNTSLIKIVNKNLIINLGNSSNINYQTLVDNIDIKNSEYNVVNSSGNIINSILTLITTNSKVNLNNSTYNIVVLGDVNCDGKISALDYIEVRKHIMGTTITDSGKVLASDMDSNSKITALDYIAIRKILMR